MAAQVKEQLCFVVLLPKLAHKITQHDVKAQALENA